MADVQILRGKRILVVDDEADVLETAKDLLAVCTITAAEDFESAQRLIKSESYDLTLLDVMGVDGFALLKACREKRIPAAMLTARALNVESVNLAIRGGAVSFLPKDKLANLPELVAEIFEELKKGQSHWTRLFERLGPYFKEKLWVDFDDLEKPPYPPLSY